MTENSSNPDKQDANKPWVPGMPWPPGQSGNPNGRPKKGQAWKDILDELLGAQTISLVMESTIGDSKKKKKVSIDLDVKDKKTVRHAITIREIQLALAKGDIAAIKDLKDRDMGRPDQKIELDHPPVSPVINITNGNVAKDIKDFADGN